VEVGLRGHAFTGETALVAHPPTKVLLPSLPHLSLLFDPYLVGNLSRVLAGFVLADGCFGPPCVVAGGLRALVLDGVSQLQSAHLHHPILVAV